MIAVLVVLPLVDPTEVVVDLFAPEKTPILYLKKRPRIDNPEAAKLEAGLTKEQQYKLIRLYSMQDEKTQQARELESVKGC